MEVHSREELEAAPLEHVDVVGVNNRNLKNFQVDLDLSYQLAELIPAEVLKISESGISSADAITALQAAGFNGFLIGEAFMQAPRPELACAQLIDAVRRKLEQPDED